ncbi:hypothetical protein C8R43DRAFT_941880 [Mycena crocata]|nr:hypothetical protein C8R43DRAFT_941880 [Mycena crocata]
MPEKAILKLFEREVGWEEKQISSKVNRDDHSAFFVTKDLFTSLSCHLPLLLLKELHQDHHIIAVAAIVDIPPRQVLPSKSTATTLATPADANDVPAEYVNKLKIRGRISALARGKELLVAICNPETAKNFLFRVTFSLEAHCFWIPTNWYRHITACPLVSRGEKSWAFPIPDDYVDGPLSDRIISIQAAFIRPDWTLIFVDHNVMIQLHLMQMSSTFTSADMAPGSPVWERLWNANHGPVYSQEPDATLQALADWRRKIVRSRAKSKNKPIFASIKDTQTVFNGSGAQEGTDLLTLAFIHPHMPAFDVCTSDAVWTRLLESIIEYDKNRIDLASPAAHLPYVSGARPFRMNNDGHKRFLGNITTYRRDYVVFTEARLIRAIELGLFQPNAVIQPDGRGIVPAGAPPCDSSVQARFRSDRRQATVRVPNICISIHGGKKDLQAYSPFTAKAASGWKKATRSAVLSDVREDVNDTTLGLYSFRILVDCAWSAQKVDKAMDSLPRGPRPIVHAGRFNRKRPLAAEIARFTKAGPKKKRKLLIALRPWAAPGLG